MIRKIHLDFHTHSNVPDVGKDFDPERFADTLVKANVNWLATPGKCDMGNTYFDSQVGHTHPHLVRADLFPATVKACAARGIKVQAYYCLAWDSHIATIHPDWRQKTKDGKYIMWGEGLLCFASPYIDTYVIPGVVEMIERCPGIVGFWFDIALYVEASFYSSWFNNLAEERLGEKAGDDFSRCRLADVLIRECCERLNNTVAKHLPNAVNFYNALTSPGMPENNALHFYKEIENPLLFGGPERITTLIRWHQAHQQPTIGLVSRFQGPWNDPGTLRTVDQIKFDVARVVATGAGISMGDHRHPDGSLDPEAYRRIGGVYGDLAKCERWLDNAKPCREATILTEIERSAQVTGAKFPEETIHAARILEENGLQFDIRSVEESFPETKLLVWSGQKPGSPALLAAIREHVRKGGCLFAMDAAIEGLEDLIGCETLAGPEKSALAGQDHEVKSAGQVQNQASGFFRITRDCELYAQWHDFAHIINNHSRRIENRQKGTVLAEQGQALINKLPWSADWPGKMFGPAIVQHGNVIYSAVPLFAEAMLTGTPFPAMLVKTLCQRLLVRPLVRHSGGNTVAAHLHKSGPGYTLHLVHFALDRWGKIINSAAEFPWLGPIDLEVVIPHPVQAVTLEPGGARIDHQWQNGVCSCTIPRMKVWQIVGITV